jgi:hypothetical protein
MLLVTSSILTHFLASSNKSWPRLLNFGRVVAVVLRRAGKTLATCNAIWIILACTLQLGGFFDRCYCNSDVIGLKNGAYDIIIGSGNELKWPWIRGLSLAFGSVFLFVAFVNLFINSKPTRCS